MDKFWSIFSVPIGLAICFAPGILVWWLTQGKEESSQEPEIDAGKRR